MNAEGDTMTPTLAVILAAGEGSRLFPKTNAPKALTRVFGLSLAAVIVTTVHNFGLSNGLEVLGGAGLAFMVVIIGVAAALLAYSRAMARAGVLT